MGKHPTEIGDLRPAEIGTLLGGLRYDCLVSALLALSYRLERDAVADFGRNRGQLADRLASASGMVERAAGAIAEAWKICEKHEGT